METYILIELLKTHPLFKSYAGVIRDLLRLSNNSQNPADNISKEDLIKAKLGEALPFFFDFIQKNQKYLDQRREEYLRMSQFGVYHFVVYGDPSYPRGLYQLPEPPLSLVIWGHEPFPWQFGQGIAVVGSREPGEESLDWMEQHLGLFLKQKKVFTVSGGARGVDQRTHALSVRQGIPTVVVLPSGIRQIYPQSLLPWAHDIIERGGCFVSEYSPDMPMQKYLFPHRNRIIAALSNCVLIIEAKEKSGTMITAQLAADLNKTAIVLPGHPIDFRFRGSLQLISEGASMVRDAEELSLIFEVEAWGQSN